MEKPSLEQNRESKKRNVPTCKENFDKYFSQYCEYTSIHGIKYIGERGRFMVEKVIWTVMVTIIGYLCVTLVLKMYIKWSTSPVIVTFATTETPIWKIPFPAITICPEVKSDPYIFNYTDVLFKKINKGNITNEQSRFFESFSLICKGVGSYLLKQFGGMRNLNIIGQHGIEDIIEAYPDVDPLNVSTVHWLLKEYTLSSVLSGTFTSEGICYSFNMLDLGEILLKPENYIRNRRIKNAQPYRWTLENGYPDEDKMDTFPRRTFLSGLNGGFLMDLYTNHSHLDYMCGESLQGFKVALHHPSELPDMNKHFRVPLDQAVLVGIKPRMIAVSAGLKSYRPEERQCYFSQEKYLRYFKRYTQNNCLHECFTNFTMKKCGCYPFYMPKSHFAKICGPGSNECVEESRLLYLSEQDDSNKKERSPCDCLPSCASLEYDVEISQSEWNWREIFTVFTRFGLKYAGLDLNGIHYSRLVVYYKELQFLTSERNELYGYADFFANTGGLLGLFMGFSVTSAIEILYFLTLRLVCNIKKYGKSFWSGEVNNK